MRRDFVEGLSRSGFHHELNALGVWEVGAWVAEVVVLDYRPLIPLLVQCVIINIRGAEVAGDRLAEIAGIVIRPGPPCRPEVNIGCDKGENGDGTKKP